MEVPEVIAMACWAGAGLIAAGMVLGFARLVLGPTLPDRVVALDALAMLGIGALVLVAMATGQAVLLDIALAMALITFLGTIALAMGLERGLFK
jgi:multicomponent Na+:H+ antiporter subunit F